MNDELAGYKKINETLKKDFLCLPPYNSVNGGFLNKIFTSLNKNQEIKYHITAEVALPFRRAYQMVYRYRELGIFNRSILEVIEFSTLAYYEGNHICAYLSLMPVIETLLREWAKKDGIENFRDPKNYILSKCKNLKQQFPIGEHYKNWMNTQIEFLEYIVNNVLYITDKNFEISHGNDDIFNRHSALHKLTDVNSANEKILLGIVRLFLIIDVISEVYLRSNWDNYKKLNGVFDLSYNPDLLELYFEFYKSRIHYGFEGSQANVINNIFLKNDLTKEEMVSTRNFIACLDRQSDFLKKVKNSLRIFGNKKN